MPIIFSSGHVSVTAYNAWTRKSNCVPEGGNLYGLSESKLRCTPVYGGEAPIKSLRHWLYPRY
ncbi:MAG: hypothetical protein FWC33_04820 [Candidatus Bathyarchaeota archaeon]|nr:hypothetical protein [Candidatus Termiticorpusculum sp.]